jgi:phosphoribosylformylglycinamidine cyclo-ligase
LAGNLDVDDMYSAFNMGIGYIVVLSKENADAVVADIRSVGEEVYAIGHIKSGTGTVELVGRN